MLQLPWLRMSLTTDSATKVFPLSVHPQPGSDAPAILLVCTANRIRSPLAQYLLLALLHKQGDDQPAWRVESAGVWAQEGLPVLRGAYRAGLAYGLDLSRHRSRSVMAAGLQEFALILTMEAKHAATLCNEFPALAPRVLTLGEAVSGSAFDIADPSHHSARAIQATAKDLAQILSKGLGALQQRLSASVLARLE